MSAALVIRAAQLRAARLWRLALGIGLGAGAILAAAGLLATSGYLISKAAQQPPILTLTVAIVGVRFFGVTRAVFRYLERLVMHDVALRAASAVRVAVFHGVANGSAARGERRASGDLLARLVEDTERLQDVVVRIVGPPLIATVTILVVSSIAALIHPVAGLVLLVGLGAGAVTSFALGLLGNLRAGRREAPRRAALTTHLTDLVSGAPELAIYGGGLDQARRLADADARLAAAANRSAWTSGLTGGWITMVTGATTVAVIAVAGLAVADGSMSGVLLAAVALLSLAAFEGIAPLGSAGERLGPMLGSTARVAQVVADGETERRGAVEWLPTGLPLVMADAKVRYAESGPWVLNGLDLTLRRGARVALVGPSGSGKSTAAHALVGMLDLDGGRATLGDIEVGMIRDDVLRARVRLLAQDAYLFATSIADNVRLARPSATEEEVREALEHAGALGWVERLPDGQMTRVGEDGALLSGGERQRIALARALLSDAELFIFDEPTVHMDADDAIDFVRHVDRALDGAGLLLITHRLHGLERFDEIVVLDAGRVVERGSHASLAAAEGWYAHALAAQSSAPTSGPARSDFP